MKLIPLTQGKFAQVDDEDFEYLSQYRWFFTHGYAIRRIYSDGKAKTIYMHREILSSYPGIETDHINLDGLDNQRKNIRVCTHHENIMNRRINKNNHSGYKGIYRHWNKWKASIKLNGINIRLGLFNSRERAARAYDKAAREYFGEFAHVNFPDTE